MAIIKSIPVKKIINNHLVDVSETSTVSETKYKTTGESLIIVKGTIQSTITLDSSTTEEVRIKSLTQTIINTTGPLIDEKYEEIEIDDYACVHFRFVGNSWYIIGSDGLKGS
jgi:hypothetical protein